MNPAHLVPILKPFSSNTSRPWRESPFYLLLASRYAHCCHVLRPQNSGPGSIQATSSTAPHRALNTSPCRSLPTDTEFPRTGSARRPNHPPRKSISSERMGLAENLEHPTP